MAAMLQPPSVTDLIKISQDLEVNPAALKNESIAQNKFANVYQ